MQDVITTIYRKKCPKEKIKIEIQSLLPIGYHSNWTTNYFLIVDSKEIADNMKDVDLGNQDSNFFNIIVA